MDVGIAASVVALVVLGVVLVARGRVRSGILMFYLAYVESLVILVYAERLDLSRPATLLAVGIPAAIITLGFLLLRTQKWLDAALEGVGQELATLLTNPVRQARRLVVLVIGATVVMIGVVLLLIPGPGLLVMVIGFGILATEFFWAQQLLKRLQREAKSAAARLRDYTVDDAGEEDTSPK